MVNYLKILGKVPPGFPVMLPPIKGYFKDDLRSFLGVKEGLCADAYFHNSNQPNRWHLLEQKTRSDTYKGLKQLEQTAKLLEERRLRIDQIWLCAKTIEGIAKSKFSLREEYDRNHGSQKILKMKGTAKDYLILGRYKVAFHKTG